ncbi:MAG: AAA family ATPase [Mycobacterium sp.]|nr:AAA family ATPase [Mycobacterium sp.]
MTKVSRRSVEESLSDFLDRTPNEPSAVVIEGEPGIGKTTLWLDAVRRAAERGFCVLAARTAAAESVLAYTALGDLLGAVDDSIWADFPPPQRHGLDAALLRQHDSAYGADGRAIAAAFLAVINKLAARGPVMVAIDDLQWLDASSANAVSFAARRLPDGVALLCTARTGSAALRLQLPSPDAVHRIELQPLAIGELHQVLTSRLGVPLSRSMLLRIHNIAGGNPFYALELAREISTRPGGVHLGLPDSLADLVRTRIGRAGPDADDVLLAVASLADPTVELVAQAADMASDRLAGLLDNVEAHEIVAVDGNRVRFTHPILAHGVYGAATPQRRRAMHRRLAGLVTEPELRARHLALSDITGDPQTLAALDAAAEIAQRRGAPAAAAELLELAIGRGGDTPQRRIHCAAYHFNAGNAVQARDLLERTIDRRAPAKLRATALGLLGLWSQLDGSSHNAASLLEHALTEAGDDIALRAQILVPLSFAQLNVPHFDSAERYVEDAVDAATGAGQPQLLSQALSMRVLVRFLLGHGVDWDSLQTALELEDRQAPISALLCSSVHKAELLAATGQLEQAGEELQVIRRRYIEHGGESELMIVAFHSGLNAIWRGDFPQAALIAEDAMDRALLLDEDIPLSVALMLRGTVAAYTGDEDDARRDAGEALAICRRCDFPNLVAVWPITTLGFLEVSLGNYHAAAAHYQPLLDEVIATPRATEIFVAGFVPDAAEALIGLGRIDDAEPLIDVFERNGRRLDRAWMLALGARSRAMLLAARGDLTAATAAATSAMSEHERLPMLFERARTQLLLGQLHRRQRHRDTAAPILLDALQTFERLGTKLWIERARSELARGMPGRRRTEGLTASERRVAELAAAGMSNRDIAATLFVSPKTVEVNLSRVYRTLGIQSRIELYRRFDGSNEFRKLKE